MSNKIEIICKTESIARRYHVKWIIESFSFIGKAKGEFIDSTIFTVRAKSKVEFYIRLYPNGYNEEGNVEVFLKGNRPYFKCRSTVAILNEQLRVAISKTEASVHGGYILITRKELLNKTNVLLPNGILTLVVDIEIFDWTTTVMESANDGVNDLALDLEKLLSARDFCDATISIGDTEFPVHKNILAIRSSVFAAMFKNDMIENKTNVIKITDIEPKVMEEALNFIYTGKCTKIDEIAADLLPFADKYNLPGLTRLCEQSLYVQLTPENASKTLIASELHNLKELKEKTQNYICRHGKEVITTSSWKDLALFNKDMELEMLRLIVQKSC